MKKFLLFVAVIFMGISLFAQTERKNFPVSDFTGIDAGGVFNIELVKADKASVVIETDAKIMEVIKVSVSRGVLHLSMNTEDLPRLLKRNMPDISVKIGIKELNYLELSGASKLTCLSSFSTNDFKADMSGASRVNDLRIDCKSFLLEASGASRMTLSGSVSGTAKYDLSGAVNLDIRQDAENLTFDGSGACKVKYNGAVANMVDISFSGASSMTMAGKGAKTMNVGISGASKFDSLEFPVRDMKVGLSGVSKADVNASNTLSTNVSGGSKLNYKGDAKTTHSAPPSIKKID